MWLKRNLPERVLRRLRGLRNATRRNRWEETRAYAIPIFYPITAVWVNLAGRQPKGIVAPGNGVRAASGGARGPDRRAARPGDRVPRS
jgi:hypothetical protein